MNDSLFSWQYVHYRIGSLEIVKMNMNTNTRVHYRIGSLEMQAIYDLHQKLFTTA